MNHLIQKQICEQINMVETLSEMRTIRDQVHEMLQERLLSDPSMELYSRVNPLHDACIRRTVQLAEKRVEQQGYGFPPVSYAFILFGSGGRSEQTLWSDQDNGIIYEDSNDHSDVELESYFKVLAETILKGLDVLGYPRCPGNVLASNSLWRKPYSTFSRMMLDWFETPDWDNFRYLLIMADMRSIYGAHGLVSNLRDEFHAYVSRNPPILEALLSNTLHHKSTLGIFGQLLTERYGEDAGGIDIKYGAYIPIVNGVRLLAIQAGLPYSSTLERLEVLIAGNHIPTLKGEKWREAFHIVLELRNLTSFQMKDGFYTTRGKLAAKQLTNERRHQLKFCLHASIELQKFVKKAVESRLDK
jgi:CBS domain-containing protein